MSQDLINNFVIQVATVNGSGSQSANTILLKSLFRMGVPVAGKNVFPSNIAGLPTWFWIRASRHGFQSRRARPHVTVAMNPQTFAEDYQLLLPGGYFIYNQDIPWPQGVEKRSDVTHFPFPVRELVDQATQQVKIKKLIANMIYVGILTDLLKIDQKIVMKTIEGQFQGKASVFDPNFKAFELGLKYSQSAFKDHSFLPQAQATEKNRDLMIIDGNSASALGLIYGGATFAAWYPITPSTSLIEAFNKWVTKVRPGEPHKYAVIQAEDELSAISMAIGAGWQGARAFTATSGPGISLMQEALGYAYYAEIPVVVWDVQRVGPSTGMPTRTAQGDLLSAVWASHGDTRHPVLLPSNAQECFEFGQVAFDIAERLQTPVLVLSDLDLGMNLWTTPKWDYPSRPFDRGEILSAQDLDSKPNYGRYLDENGDGVAPRVLPGTPHPKAAYLTRGSGHDVYGRYTEKAQEYRAVVDRIALKWETAKSLVPGPLIKESQSSFGILYYGSSRPAVEEACWELEQKGLAAWQILVRALPLTAELKKVMLNLERIYVVDLNRDGQLHLLLRMEYPELAGKFISIRHYDGTPIPSESVFDPIWQRESL